MVNIVSAMWEVMSVYGSVNDNEKHKSFKPGFKGSQSLISSESLFQVWGV